jgi:YHS domain-containing protein/uncharacterized membrane protein YraQ (UPF0718 family)
MTVPLAASAPVWAGRGLREAFFMFWETLWPLVLGFGLSGAVQAFVPREQMERTIGNRRPATLARASGYGMVSSSCSYAATAMAKSLFAKGADFVTAMVFMIASTNLVLELGIVLIVLMGWQFAAAEFVGGPIMIALLGVLGGWWFARRLTDPARQSLQRGELADGHDHEAMVGVSAQRRAELEAEPWRTKLRSKAAWADSASYTMADLTMLRRELLIGYGIAGFLAVLVPTHVWNNVFVHGHGFWTSLENVMVGPLIAVVSFVCSIGNVPLAAALWRGGISFGGVVSFIFADLIAFPLLLIYRKYYGGALALRILAGFWAVMAAGGLIVEGLFSAAGLVPHSRSAQVVPTSFHWNYTTVLNIAFLVVFAILYRLYRNRARLGGGQGYAFDPVCGMQVRTDDAPARTAHHGRTIYFCSDRCKGRFIANPGRHGSHEPGDGALHHPGSHAMRGVEEPTLADAVGAARDFDPVCGMTVEPATAAAHRRRGLEDLWFCSDGCASAFDASPERYLSDRSGQGESA